MSSENEIHHHPHHVPLLPIVLEHEAELPPSHHHSANEFEEADEVDELNDQDFDVLPILSYEKQILQAIRGSQITIIIGETGSGKTTQIPQIIMKYAKEFLEKEITAVDISHREYPVVKEEKLQLDGHAEKEKKGSRWDRTGSDSQKTDRDNRGDRDRYRDRDRDRDKDRDDSPIRGRERGHSRDRTARDRSRERRRDDSRDRGGDRDRDRGKGARWDRDSRGRYRSRSTSSSRSRSPYRRRDDSTDRRDRFGRDLDRNRERDHEKDKGNELNDKKETDQNKGILENLKLTIKQEPQTAAQSLLQPRKKLMKMAITQPRRIAAISVAQRVQEEYETMVKKKKLSIFSDKKTPTGLEEDKRDPNMENHLQLGGTVGYIVRFDDQTSSDTRVKFMTDGILIRECLSDPLLSQYSIIMLDEAHERSLNTDILFGLLKQVCRKRSNLKVIVTSATLDSEKFGSYFNNCPIIHIPGRLYPVDIYHSKTKQIMTLSGPANNSYIQSAVDIVLKIHHRKASTGEDKDDDGHILVFLTGSDEIEKACFLLNQALKEEREGAQQGAGQSHRIPEKELIVLPLYSALSNDDQVKVFQKPTILYDQMMQKRRRERGYSHGHSSNAGTGEYPKIIRKCVISTNIAETSITVPHVRYVIDAGFVKQKVFDPPRGIESLIVVPVSKIAALQRAGRAGRTGPGQCYRLYSSECFDNFNDETIPEIQRTNLANTILYLKAIGIEDILAFDFLDPPSREQVLQALIQLNTLRAIDDKGHITGLGRKMSSFPLDPHLSRMMIESGSKHCDCLEEMVIVCSMLCVENVWYKPRSNPGNRFNKSQPQRNGSGARGAGGQGGPQKNHYGPGGGEEVFDEGRNRLTALTQEEERCEIAHAGLRHDYGDFHTYWNIFIAFERANYSYDWCERNFINFRSMKTAKKIREALLVDARKARLHELEFPIIPGNDKKDSKGREKEFSLEKRMSHAITAGYFMNAATRCVNDSVYKCVPLIDQKTKKTQAGTTNVDVRLVHMHPQSTYAVLKPSEFVIFQELVNSTKLFIKNVAKVSGKVLEQHQHAWHFVDPRFLNGEDAAPTSSSNSGKDRERSQIGLENEPSHKRSKVEEIANGSNKTKSSGIGSSDESKPIDSKALSAVEQAKLRYLNRKGSK